MAEYESAQKGTLRLKGIGELSAGKKKKKKDKEKDKMIEQMMTNMKNEEEKKKPALDKRTPAQIAFEKMQEKRDFNRHLDTLTEHYDIPKVSWTK
ncbi:protein FAM32A isoform X2 [Ranitomeya imitator]|uniref:protein FAM32A isoform X2 n=1 Tax=Ranitomeya imitator TaxID=111125 RepID=UPI0037E7ABB7